MEPGLQVKKNQKHVENRFQQNGTKPEKAGHLHTLYEFPILESNRRSDLSWMKVEPN